MNRFVIVASLPLMLAGCISPNPKPAFEDVKREVTAHIGETVQWSRGSSSANEITKLIEPLLGTNLTAQTAVKIALLNNRALQAEFEEIGISQADLAQASRLQNIEVAGTWRFPNRPPSAADIEYSAAGNFLDLLTQPARKKIAKSNLEQTKLRVANSVLELATEAQKAYYELQAESDLGKRLSVILDVNNAQADFAERQFKAGNINNLELNNNQVLAVQTHLDLMQVKAQIESQREQLNRLFGLNAEQNNWQVSDALPPLPAEEPPLENLEFLAVSNRWDLAASRRQAESILSAFKLKAQTRFFPGAKIGVDTERTPDGQRVTGPTLDLELPIFDQGQAGLARIKAELEQAKDSYAAQEINVRSEVREARSQLLAARETVIFAEKKLLPLRQRILGETMLHYNAMQKSAYELLAAKEREQNAEQTNVEALKNYWMARVKLERAVGGRLLLKSDFNSASSKSEPTPETHH